MNYRQTASEILQAVGGSENIRSATHCMTRLRLILSDEGIPNDKAVESIDGVLRVIRQGGQYQVVIGNEVPKVYAEIKNILPANIEESAHSEGSSNSKSEKGGFFSRIFGFIASAMTPLLPAMLGGGMVKVLLTLLTAFNLISDSSSTYTILYLIGDAFFYFIPIMLASTVAKRLGSSQMLAMLIAAILLHPDLSVLFEGGNSSFLGIPVISASYASSVLPILLIVPVMKYIEIFADRISPNVVKVFLKPLIVILISAPLALIVLGPIGSILGNFLADGVNFLYKKAGWLTLMILSAAMPFIIMTGMHYALIPLATISLTSIGYDPILTPTMFCSNLAQSGASLAVAAKSKDRNMRQISLGSGISAAVAGVTEPALYGVTLKLKKPLVAACIAAGLGGLFAGLSGVVAYTLGGSPSVFSLITMIGGEGYRTLIAGILTLVIVMASSFFLTLIFYRERSEKPAEAEPPKEAENSSKRTESTESSLVFAPMQGKVIPLSSVADATFASGVLGKGCAIKPFDGHLYAPFDGSIENLFDTLHAIALKGANGVELLMHIGRDTVELGGKYFKAYCKNGDRVKAGDLLIDFDMEGLSKAGYDLTTPIIVANSDRFDSVGIVADGKTGVGDKLLSLIRKKSPKADS